MGLVINHRKSIGTIMSKLTSGRMCIRAVARRTPAPKERRREVNTTCKTIKVHDDNNDRIDRMKWQQLSLLLFMHPWWRPLDLNQ